MPISYKLLSFLVDSHFLIVSMNDFYRNSLHTDSLLALIYC